MYYINKYINIPYFSEVICSSKDKHKPIRLITSDPFGHEYDLLPCSLNETSGGYLYKSIFTVDMKNNKPVLYSRKKLYETFVKDKDKNSRLLFQYDGINDLVIKDTVDTAQYLYIRFNIY